MQENENNIYVRRAEQKLVRALEKHGSLPWARAWYGYGQGTSKEEFFLVVSRLEEKGRLERMDGKVLGTYILVRKDLVGEVLAGKVVV